MGAIANKESDNSSIILLGHCDDSDYVDDDIGDDDDDDKDDSKG